MKNITGCYKCIHLSYYEKDGYEDSSEERYFCNKRETEHFKKFPCERILKCFEHEPREE